ncbi:MAG: IS1634 family transposase [Ignavibacteria bacterium]
MYFSSDNHEAFPDGTTFVLYDLTSTYFEGRSPDKMGKYGYSRDHRDDRKQIILAIAVDASGVPIHMEVLKGNRADNSTLKPLLENLRRRFGLKKAVFVFDGGMSSTLNLEQMKAEEMDYITRLSASTLQALIKGLPQDNQPEFWDRDQLVELEINGTRYVIAGSEFRQQRDYERRNVRITKGINALMQIAAVNRKKIDVQKLSSQVGRKLLTLKAHKYFEYHVNQDGKLEWKLKSSVVEQECRLDGWYVLTTSISPKTADKEFIFKGYRNLLEVESAFRQIKSYLKVRPVFHYRPDRVRNHIRICFLAYWISARLGTEWLACGETREVPLLLAELQQIKIGKLRVGRKTVKTLITDIPKKIQKTLEKIKVFHIFNTMPKWAL